MPLRGTLMVPGDKSITHRAIILSALADGEATLTNYCPGEDCLHTAAAFQAMGVPIEIAADRLRVAAKACGACGNRTRSWTAGTPARAFACSPACSPDRTSSLC